MQQPPGYVQVGNNGQPLVCQLTKALYGLRQAPCAWFDKLKSFLVAVGFVASKSDVSLFVRITDSTQMFILVYVDGIIIIGSVSSEIDGFIKKLHAEFSLKDMGELHYF